MKLKTLFIVIPFVLAYFMLNFIFLSTEEEYTSMSDYIESTKNEFSYDIQEVIYEENWTGYHIKMISGEWLDSKKVDQVEWWHYVDIIIPKQTTSSSGITLPVTTDIFSIEEMYALVVSYSIDDLLFVLTKYAMANKKPNINIIIPIFFSFIFVCFN